MPISTATDVKLLLGLATNATRDALITKILPMAQAKVISHCCAGSFLLLDAQLISGGIAFVSGTTAKITDSGAGFMDALLKAGDVNIRLSQRNDKIVSVTTVSAGELTLAAGETLIDEAATGSQVIITQVQWPEEIPLDFSRLMLYYLYTRGQLADSEALPGGYAVKYKSEAEVMQLFTKYRRIGAA